ncbi:DUF6221 family protein [Streptomyces sp. KR55]|uniref:DUF6221 family protein n=1 Tax=Streptomyces sp. KR55 TaxID=3457425 RepID=UPI003FD39390
MTADLVAFVRARLDEDERIAHAASWADEANAWHAEPSPFGARDNGQRWFIEDAMDDGVVTHVDPAASDDEGVARHIARHDPARVLAEIDAKRRILAEHQPDRFGDCTTCAGPEDFDDDADGHRTWSRSAKPFPCPTLRLLALPYADHPDYREEWRP